MRRRRGRQKLSGKRIGSGRHFGKCGLARTPKGQPPGCGRESLRFRRRQKDKRCLSVYFYTRKQGNVGCEISTPLPSSALRETATATSALRCPKNAAHIRLLAFFVLPPFVRFADISPAGGIFRCGNSGFASERLAAFAVPGPVSRRPANGAAAEIPVTLHLPPAARNRNPATGSAKPQFPPRGRQDPCFPLGGSPQCAHWGIGGISIPRCRRHRNFFISSSAQ